MPRVEKHVPYMIQGQEQSNPKFQTITQKESED